MTLLYASPKFQEHITGAHPEHPRRLAAIDAHLHKTGLYDRASHPSWQPAQPTELARVHAPPYIAEIEKYAAAGGGRIEADTVLSDQSYQAASLAAGAVSDAVRRVVSGADKSALCLVRPPGHHARPATAMGFCLFNNIAVGARAALADHQLDHVLIVDWDVHHGNGTQEMFWEDGRIAFLSIHRWPFYPGTGDVDETGSGKGLGMISNVPVAYGTPVTEFHDRFERALTDLAAKTRPQLILISAGFDAHRQDPIGSLDLEIEDFSKLTKTVLAVARQYADGRVVSVLEGGYNPTRLGESVGVHLESLLSQSN